MPGSRNYLLQDKRVLECAGDGAVLRSERDAVDIIGLAFECRADWIVIPVARFEDAFFALRTRVAGEFLQKFVNYDFRVALVGDIARHVAGSAALRDFVAESNRGNQVWFLPDMDAFAARLAPKTSA